jgi:uncharacterized membrane protein YgcG
MELTWIAVTLYIVLALIIGWLFCQTMKARNEADAWHLRYLEKSKAYDALSGHFGKVRAELQACREREKREAAIMHGTLRDLQRINSVVTIPKKTMPRDELEAQVSAIMNSPATEQMVRELKRAQKEQDEREHAARVARQRREDEDAENARRRNSSPFDGVLGMGYPPATPYVQPTPPSPQCETSAPTSSYHSTSSSSYDSSSSPSDSGSGSSCGGDSGGGS